MKNINYFQQLFEERGCFLPELEKWKPAKNYEGLYWVSQYGNVKNNRGMLIAPGRDSHGYPTIAMNADKKRRASTKHILVWDHYGNLPRDGRRITVDHIFEDKDFNCIWNLQLLRNRDNKLKFLRNNPKRSGLPIGVFHSGGKSSTSPRKYRTEIYYNGALVKLGYYQCPVVALNVYDEAERKYYPHIINELYS